jgi:FkbM family methyltransferase
MNLEAVFDIRNKFNFYPNTILDIGANNGWFANLCKIVWPNCSISMIEASPEHEPALRNMHMHYMITLLGDKQDIVKFYIMKNERGSTGNSIYKEISVYYNEENCEVIEMPMDLLDNVVTDTYDFIKMDTQGSELDIIRGGLKTIKKAKYVLLEASLVDCNEGAPLKQEVVDYMKSINFELIYSPFSHVIDGKLIQEDLLFRNTIQ